MRSTILALLFATSSIGLTSEANAVVYCAVGVYRAGCVARPVVRHRAVVVAPACRMVNGIRVCR
jgi:hypothetical protein